MYHTFLVWEIRLKDVVVVKTHIFTESYEVVQLGKGWILYLQSISKVFGNFSLFCLKEGPRNLPWCAITAPESPAVTDASGNEAHNPVRDREVAEWMDSWIDKCRCTVLILFFLFLPFPIFYIKFYMNFFFSKIVSLVLQCICRLLYKKLASHSLRIFVW